jgi:Flp pilus assembly protein TadG
MNLESHPKQRFTRTGNDIAAGQPVEQFAQPGLASSGSSSPKNRAGAGVPMAARGGSPDLNMSKRLHVRAQALLEFALALPILLLVVYGLLEAGRLIFTYAAVATASREAVRYASAAGKATSGSQLLTYESCDQIRARAKNTGFLLNLQDDQIRIYWDHPGPYNTEPLTQYCFPGNPSDTNVGTDGAGLQAGDRVLVTVTTQYTLLLPLVPFTSRTISSGYTARTFMGMIDLSGTQPP